MKFSCRKCNSILTNDLFLTTKTADDSYIDDDSGEVISKRSTIIPGSFKKYRYQTLIGRWPLHKLWSRSVRVWTERVYAINPVDAKGCFLQPFVAGNGCCANHHIEVECNNCYSHVGWEYSDCYESLQHIKLLKDKVNIDFSSRTYVEHQVSGISINHEAKNVTADSIVREVNAIMKAFKLGQTKPYTDDINPELHPDGML